MTSRRFEVVAAVAGVNERRRPSGEEPDRPRTGPLRRSRLQPLTPVAGRQVSDGYSRTATDENGVYQLTGCEHFYQIYVFGSAEYEIPLGEGLPRFWQQIAAGPQTLRLHAHAKLAGGKGERSLTFSA